MKYVCFLLLALSVFFGCASTENGEGGLSLLEAVEQSSEKIAAELEKGSRVAIVAFESENENLSDFIMEELTGALVDRGIEVADRQNLDYVFKELGFQWSGNVDDEEAQSIGKFLAAEVVITGQFTDMGGAYRYRTSAVQVEKGTRDIVTRLTVAGGEKTRGMLAAFASQKNAAKTAKYGVTEKTEVKTAGTFLDRGILFASRGDYTMAITDFTEALKLDPDIAAAYSLRGRALYASASFVTSTGDNFSSVGTAISIGEQVSPRRARVYEQAIADFTQAIRLDPDSAKNYAERAGAYNAQGDVDKALADLNQAIRLGPNYAVAYNGRGLAYINQGDYDKAIADYNQAIRLDPNLVAAYTGRGFAYASKNDYDRAVADYNQAIRLDPDYAVAYNNRGLAYINQGDYDKAIADCNRAIRLNPDYAVAYNNRGLAYNNKGDYDKAIADYNQAIRLDPNFGTAYKNRGVAYYNKGDYDRAIADQTEAIRLNPDFAIAYNERGVAYYCKEDYDKAIADYNQAIRLDPNYAVAYSNRGLAYINQGDDDKAITDYNQAIRLNPDYFDAYSNRGNAYYLRKDYNRAVADYEAALRINPNHAGAREVLEKARRERGR